MRLETLERAMLSSGPFVSRDDLPSLDAARMDWLRVRKEHGFAGYGRLLTPPTGNVKLEKSDAPTYGLTLAPAMQSGLVNACAWATAGCIAACVLVTAGKGSVPNVIRARNARTDFARQYPGSLVRIVLSELESAVEKYGAIVMRLNVASDVRWERVAPVLFTADGVRFYDYTKAPVSQRPTLPDNYSLTHSASERTTVEQVRAIVESGRNVAVVLRVKRGRPLPATWHGMRVIDGDVSDDRTLDPVGVIVGLRAKGAGIRDQSGFVKEVAA